MDEVEQDKLDQIDEIVFDSSATLRCRQEALLFVMDHTEGFDDICNGQLQHHLEDEPPHVEAASKKRGAATKKAKRDSDADSGSLLGLAQRQRNARQLETLVEFTAHHVLRTLPEAAEEGEGAVALSGRVDEFIAQCATLLIDACYGLPKSGITTN